MEKKTKAAGRADEDLTQSHAARQEKRRVLIKGWLARRRRRRGSGWRRAYPDEWGSKYPGREDVGGPCLGGGGVQSGPQNATEQEVTQVPLHPRLGDRWHALKQDWKKGGEKAGSGRGAKVPKIRYEMPIPGRGGDLPRGAHLKRGERLRRRQNGNSWEFRKGKAQIIKLYQESQSIKGEGQVIILPKDDRGKAHRNLPRRSPFRGEDVSTKLILGESTKEDREEL